MTLNKDTKTPGGCTGFSRNVNAGRWEINAAYRAALRTCFHKHLDYQPQNYKHPDLNLSRIKKEENDVQHILATIETTFADPFCPSQLKSISTGVLANEKAESDIHSAKEKRQAAFDTFVKTRLSKEKTMSIFDPIKKMKLSSFSSMNKTKKCKVNLKIIPVQASKELFAKISLVAQIPSLDMRSVFKFPTSKTSKATLLHKLEGPVEPLEKVSGDYAMVFDRMTYVQQSQVSNKTFSQLSTDLLEKILTTGSKAARSGVVFDVYRNLFIKNVERNRRSKG